MADNNEELIVPNNINSLNSNVVSIKHKIYKINNNLNNLNEKVDFINNDINEINEKINSEDGNIETGNIEVQTGILNVNVEEDDDEKRIVNKKYVDDKFAEKGNVDFRRQNDFIESVYSITSQGSIAVGCDDPDHPDESKIVLNSNGSVISSAVITDEINVIKGYVQDIPESDTDSNIDNRIVNKKYVDTHGGGIKPEDTLELKNNDVSMTASGNVYVGYDYILGDKTIELNKNGSIYLGDDINTNDAQNTTYKAIELNNDGSIYSGYDENNEITTNPHQNKRGIIIDETGDINIKSGIIRDEINNASNSKSIINKDYVDTNFVKQSYIDDNFVNKNALIQKTSEDDNTIYTKDKTNEILEGYLTKSDASNTYLSKTEASNEYLTISDASNNYLSKSEASAEYLTISDASNEYLSKSDASNEYLSKSDASNEYLSKSDASNEYAYKSSVESLQGTVESIQGAVNGITNGTTNLKSVNIINNVASINESGKISGTSLEVSGSISGNSISGSSLEVSGSISGNSISGSSLEVSGDISGNNISGSSLEVSGDISGNSISGSSFKTANNNIFAENSSDNKTELKNISNITTSNITTNKITMNSTEITEIEKGTSQGSDNTKLTTKGYVDDTITSSINTLITNTITPLQEQVNTNTTDIATNTTAIETNTSNIETIDTILNDNDTGLIKKVEQNTTNIETIDTILNDNDTGLIKKVNKNTADIITINEQLESIAQNYYVEDITKTITEKTTDIIFYRSGSEGNYEYKLMEWKDTIITPDPTYIKYIIKNVPNNTSCIVKNDATYIKTGDVYDDQVLIGQVWFKNSLNFNDTLNLTNQLSMVASGKVQIGGTKENPNILLKPPTSLEDGVIISKVDVKVGGSENDPNILLDTNGNITSHNTVCVGTGNIQSGGDYIKISAEENSGITHSYISSTNTNGINIESDLSLNNNHKIKVNGTNDKSLEIIYDNTNKANIKSNDDINIYKGTGESIGNNNGIKIDNDGVNVNGSLNVSTIKMNNQPITSLSVGTTDNDTLTTKGYVDDTITSSINTLTTDTITPLQNQVNTNSSDIELINQKLENISQDYYVEEITLEPLPTEKGADIIFYRTGATEENYIYTLMEWNSGYKLKNVPNNTTCLVKDDYTYIKIQDIIEDNTLTGQVWVKNAMKIDDTIYTTNEVSMVASGDVKIGSTDNEPNILLDSDGNIISHNTVCIGKGDPQTIGDYIMISSADNTHNYSYISSNNSNGINVESDLSVNDNSVSIKDSSQNTVISLGNDGSISGTSYKIGSNNAFASADNTETTKTNLQNIKSINADSLTTSGNISADTITLSTGTVNNTNKSIDSGLSDISIVNKKNITDYTDPFKTSNQINLTQQDTSLTTTGKVIIGYDNSATSNNKITLYPEGNITAKGKLSGSSLEVSEDIKGNSLNINNKLEIDNSGNINKINSDSSKTTIISNERNISAETITGSSLNINSKASISNSGDISGVSLTLSNNSGNTSMTTDKDVYIGYNNNTPLDSKIILESTNGNITAKGKLSGSSLEVSGDIKCDSITLDNKAVSNISTSSGGTSIVADKDKYITTQGYVDKEISSISTDLSKIVDNETDIKGSSYKIINHENAFAINDNDKTNKTKLQNISTISAESGTVDNTGKTIDTLDNISIINKSNLTNYTEPFKSSNQINLTGGDTNTPSLTTKYNVIVGKDSSNPNKQITLNGNDGSITADGSITGTSLNVSSGNITGGNITGSSISSTGSITGKSITGTSLNVSSGNITGGSISGSSLSINTNKASIENDGKITGLTFTTKDSNGHINEFAEHYYYHDETTDTDINRTKLKNVMTDILYLKKNTASQANSSQNNRSNSINNQKSSNINNSININKTITHNTLIDGNINNYHVGNPVFLIDNHIYSLEKINNNNFKYIEINKDNYLKNSINQVPKLTNKNNGKFIGVITAIYPANTLLKIDGFNSCIKIDNDTIDFATHGDYVFKVDNNKIKHNTTSGSSKIYEIGDEILYDGRIIDPELPLPRKLENMIVGKITYIPDDNTEYVSVFKN